MTNYVYRKNNLGQPCYWGAEIVSHPNEHKGKSIAIAYGIVGGKRHYEWIKSVQKDIRKEVISKYNDKRKVGYKAIEELKDDSATPPVEDVLYQSPIFLGNLRLYLEDYQLV